MEKLGSSAAPSASHAEPQVLIREKISLVKLGNKCLTGLVKAILYFLYAVTFVPWIIDISTSFKNKSIAKGAVCIARIGKMPESIKGIPTADLKAKLMVMKGDDSKPSFGMQTTRIDITDLRDFNILGKLTPGFKDYRPTISALDNSSITEMDYNRAKESYDQAFERLVDNVLIKLNEFVYNPDRKESVQREGVVINVVDKANGKIQICIQTSGIVAPLRAPEPFVPKLPVAAVKRVSLSAAVKNTLKGKFMGVQSKITENSRAGKYSFLRSNKFDPNNPSAFNVYVDVDGGDTTYERHSACNPGPYGKKILATEWNMFDSTGTALPGHPNPKLIVPPTSLAASNIGTYAIKHPNEFEALADELIDNMEIALAEKAFSKGFYVSTDGRHIDWLHLRLETKPKWYKPR